MAPLTGSGGPQECAFYFPCEFPPRAAGKSFDDFPLLGKSHDITRGRPPCLKNAVPGCPVDGGRYSRRSIPTHVSSAAVASLDFPNTAVAPLQRMEAAENAGREPQRRHRAPATAAWRSSIAPGAGGEWIASLSLAMTSPAATPTGSCGRTNATARGIAAAGGPLSHRKRGRVRDAARSAGASPPLPLPFPPLGAGPFLSRGGRGISGEAFAEVSRGGAGAGTGVAAAVS